MSALDPAITANLEGSIAELEQLLLNRAAQETPVQSRHPSGLVDRFAEAARHFEDSHPGLSGTIGGVIDALGRMGI
jgi:hypothetical protein